MRFEHQTATYDFSQEQSTLKFIMARILCFALCKIQNAHGVLASAASLSFGQVVSLGSKIASIINRAWQVH